MRCTFKNIVLSLALLAFSAPAFAGWRDVTNLPAAVSDAVAAAVDDGLYVMSGALGQGLRQFFEFYDTKNDGWRPLTPMPASLWRFSLTAGNGQLFVIGGRDQGTGDMSRGPCLFFCLWPLFFIRGGGLKKRPCFALCLAPWALGTRGCGDARTGGKCGLDKKG
jgi:hypothetical protein